MTARLFFSYAHEDEALRDELEKYLIMLKRQGLIEAFHDRAIIAGDEIDKVIDAELDKADIILFLVSPDFLASDYCYDIEMQRAMERHEAGEARVIPVILRPCDWHGAPFGKLRATPNDGEPVIKWVTLDDAFLNITKDIRKAVEDMTPAPETKQQPHSALADMFSQHTGLATSLSPALPRSANLSVTKRFTDRDKDTFLHETFEYIANYIEGSLKELERRHANIETDFRRIDANKLTATIYMDGDKKSFGKIFMGGMFGKGINYSDSDFGDDSSCNECLHIEHDDHALFIKPMMSGFSQQEKDRLTQEGAAEFYWNKLMAPLQNGDW